VSTAVVAAKGTSQGAATIDQAGEQRSAQIESLRALAALSVLVCHVTLFYIVLGTTNRAFAHLSFVDRLLYGGGFGVCLFFALTGYLIFRPFVKRLYAGTAPISVSAYGLNRVLRILPLYVVCLAVVLAVKGEPLSTWVRFFTFTQNLSSETAGQVNGPAWSLAVELQFYVLLPLFALSLGRFARSIRAAAAIIAALGVASLVARWHLDYAPDATDPTWHYRLATNFIFFVPGMLLALFEVGLRGRPPRLRGVLANSDAWLVAGVALWLVVVFGGYDLDFLICLASFLVIAPCVLALRQGPLLATLRFRPLALLGVASYSLYLWHVPLLEFVTSAGASPELGPLAALAIPLALLVAFISYRLIEEPFLRLRRRWAS
jgi:peptidoglycan/LPS O-acetylase OafA/YrhL